MSGDRDLRRLLAGLEPRLSPEPHVFVLAPGGTVPAGVRPFATIVEDEGLTLVVTQAEADRTGLAYDYVAARITMQVHSDLAAIGMTAAMSTALGDAGMSCNVIAASFHDHLLVPWDRADEAVRLLEALARD